jgi:hypothetical protein
MSIITGVGSPGTVSAASGGYVLSFNQIYSTPTQVLGFDPQRKKITFHNPGTNDIFIAPVYVQNTGSDVPLIPSAAALGGCFRVYGNGGTLVIEGECQKPWQAFCATGTTNALTVVPTHV